jgi:hypothetical protein
MNNKEWNKALDKLNFIMGNHSKLDAYVVFNVVAPLRRRLLSGEHSLNLYREIMRLDFNSYIKSRDKTESKPKLEK